MRFNSVAAISFCLFFLGCSSLGVLGDLTGSENRNVPSDGLIAHYKLDTQAGSAVVDETESNHNGEISGSSSWTYSGQYDGALEFDGSNFVTIKSKSDLAVLNMTLGFWINTEKFATRKYWENAPRNYSRFRVTSF